jgi:hypothetical protein
MAGQSGKPTLPGGHEPRVKSKWLPCRSFVAKRELGATAAALCVSCCYDEAIALMKIRLAGLSSEGATDRVQLLTAGSTQRRAASRRPGRPPASHARLQPMRSPFQRTDENHSRHRTSRDSCTPLSGGAGGRKSDH